MELVSRVINQDKKIELSVYLDKNEYVVTLYDYLTKKELALARSVSLVEATMIASQRTTLGRGIFDQLLEQAKRGLAEMVIEGKSPPNGIYELAEELERINVNGKVIRVFKLHSKYFAIEDICDLGGCYEVVVIVADGPLRLVERLRDILHREGIEENSLENLYRALRHKMYSVIRHG